MYSIFHKSSFTLQPTTQHLKRYTDFFNFTELAHPDKLEAFENDASFQSSALDFAAAGIASLMAKTAPNEEFLRMSLECCRDLMLHKGYVEDYAYDLSQVIGEAYPPDQAPLNLIVILGCQTDIMIQSRSYAGASLYYDLHHLKAGKTRVLFSGLTTLTGKEKKIAQEFKRIKYYFFEKLEALFQSHRKELHQQLDCDAEYESQSSVQNIRNLISSVLFTKYTNSRINLFMVSSTCHLYRLAGEMEKMLTADDVALQLTERNIQVNQLCFIGAENYKNSFEVITLPEYVKSMTYEVFTALFKNRLIK